MRVRSLLLPLGAGLAVACTDGPTAAVEPPRPMAILHGQPDAGRHPYVGLLVMDDEEGPAWRCSPGSGASSTERGPTRGATGDRPAARAPRSPLVVCRRWPGDLAPLAPARPPDFLPDAIMLLDVARAALDERGFLYDVIPDDTLLRFRLQGRSAAYFGTVRTDEEWEQVGVLVTSPVFLPEPSRLRVAELLTRVNFGLRIGCFELDLEDGEWRFRVSVDVEGGELTSRMVNLMLSAALAAMDDHHDATLRVAYGDVGPAQAYADVQVALRARAMAERCEARDEAADAVSDAPVTPEDDA